MTSRLEGIDKNVCKGCGDDLNNNGVDLKPHMIKEDKEEYYEVCCTCGNRVLKTRPITVHAEDRFIISSRGEVLDSHSFNYEDYKCDFSNLEE